ncbi:hypothetical protein [Lewinella sp. IMCC34191]|uniref:hypothetical protein n=1 Tax=Lewinella sp. IMCC34191 TaxID=2259172 RepID=UPI00130062CE|nr:hypothetical protein [Lewinella sp. IMCC34191]
MKTLDNQTLVTASGGLAPVVFAVAGGLGFGGVVYLIDHREEIVEGFKDGFCSLWGCE